MDPLLIFCTVGLVISLVSLIYAIRVYIRGRKAFNRFMEAINIYLKEEAKK